MPHPLTQLMLPAIFQSLHELMTRFLQENSGPDLDTPATRQQMQSAPTSNTISERDFAKLDYLICQKPSATTLALEVHILFTNNQTSAWLVPPSMQLLHETIITLLHLFLDSSLFGTA